MIGLDTNVFLRFLLQDDPKWSPIATRFVETELTPGNPGYINICTLIEIVWSLRSQATYSRERIAILVEELLRADNIVLGNRDSVERALDAFRRGKAGFADYLIADLNRQAGCSTTMTIDKAAARSSAFEALGDWSGAGEK